jgi:hypothetical protein
VLTEDHDFEPLAAIIDLRDDPVGRILAISSDCSLGPFRWRVTARSRLRIRMVDSNMPFSAVRASRGKVVRADPGAAPYEQSRVHHVGSFAELQGQMCAFTTDFGTRATSPGWLAHRNARDAGEDGDRGDVTVESHSPCGHSVVPSLSAGVSTVPTI